MGVLRYLSDGGRKSAPHGLLLVVTVVCYYNPCCCRRQRAFPTEFAVPTLRQCLEALPHRDVRGIATRLGVRRRGEHRKAGWIEGILQAWLASAGQAQIIAGLSPAARRAAIRLAQGGEFPAQLFLAEYGAVRRPRPDQRWLPPPWEAPQTISEELYYCGLLAATPPALLEKAVRLTLPADLQFLFAADALLGVFPPLPMTLAIRLRLCCTT